MSRKSKALQFADQEYKTSVTGRQIAVTETMKDYALEKISKLERYGHRIIEVNIILDVQKLDQLAEIIVKMDQGKFSASAHTTDIYVSIDQAVNKVEHQLLRYKNRLHDHHLQARAKTAVKNREQKKAAREAAELDDLYEPDNSTFSEHIIMREDSKPLKILSYDEAIAHMEATSDPCVIFKHQEDPHLTIKAIYRLKDGHYGIVEAYS